MVEHPEVGLQGGVVKDLQWAIPLLWITLVLRMMMTICPRISLQEEKNSHLMTLMRGKKRRTKMMRKRRMRMKSKC